MRRHFKYLAILLFLAALPASAQSILPNSFAGWTGTAKAGLTPPVIYDGDKPASKRANLESSARMEFGFVDGEEGAYTRGADNLRVTLYRMKDPTGGFAEFSYLQTGDMSRAELGQNAAISRDRMLVQFGNIVLDVHGSDLRSHERDLRLLVLVVDPQADHGLLPTLGQHLPEKDRIAGTDRYLLGPLVLHELLPVSEGDWLGFSDGAEAELVKYRSRGNDVTLLLADYPTPQLAVKRLVELQKVFNVNGANAQSNLPTVYAKRSLTLIGIAFGAHSQAEADNLLKQVNSRTELTWNEPTFSLTEPSFPAMIVGAFVGTGIICLFAMISGIAFGGIRLVIKRFYPNKVFDRGSQIQVLQLGLSSKPINAEDFYSLGGTNTQ
jgi:hypothetical protein